MAEQPTPAPAAAPAPQKGLGKLPIIITIVGVIFLGGGGAGAFFVLRRPAGPEIAAKPKPPGAGGVVSFEPFVVNLADPGVARFLRVSVRLIVGEAEEAERIQKNEVTLTRMRSGILELLTEQTSDKLVTADGKAALKTKISEKAHAILEPAEVTDVLFSDFVVQF